jgi:SAM-dependent methyltransferase
MRIGTKFMRNYVGNSPKSILEIGAYNVNGSLRDAKPQHSEWVGLDIEEGPGVDVVVPPGEALPFESHKFDAVVASSVFEHDPQFWKTMREMARVTKPDGLIYISAPSNGHVHRFPMDCFRFYPDAGVALLRIIQEIHPRAQLLESFLSEQDHEGVWNDFVAVFAMTPEGYLSAEKILETEAVTNAWSDGRFSDDTFSLLVEDRRKLVDLIEKVDWLYKQNREFTESLTGRDVGSFQRILELEHDLKQKTSEVDEIHASVSNLKQTLDDILESRSWRWTRPLRILAGIDLRRKKN